MDAGVTGLDGRAVDAVLSGHATAAQIKVAVDRLVGTGKAVVWTEHTGGRPRRTLVLSQYADKADKADKGSRR